MNAALLRSVSPASCGLDPQTRYGLRGFVPGFVVSRTAARFPIARKGDEQRGFWVAANSSRAPWLPQRPRPVRNWELLVTTNWRDVDVLELRALLTGTKQNCDQFPKLNPDGSIQTPVSPVKLQRAIQHSFIVVAMYIRGLLSGPGGSTGPDAGGVCARYFGPRAHGGHPRRRGGAGAAGTRDRPEIDAAHGARDLPLRHRGHLRHGGFKHSALLQGLRVRVRCPRFHRHDVHGV